MYLNIDYVAIGLRIRKHRIDMKLTQQRLAELSGIEPSNISHIERGATKLSLPTLIKIANTLETTADELLCDSIYKSKDIFLSEISNDVKECSEEEIRVISDVVKTLKISLRKIKNFEGGARGSPLWGWCWPCRPWR